MLEGGYKSPVDWEGLLQRACFPFVWEHFKDDVESVVLGRFTPRGIYRSCTFAGFCRLIA